MPLVTHLFPGSSITPATILATEIVWWLRFAGLAKSHAKQVDERKRAAGRGK